MVYLGYQNSQIPTLANQLVPTMHQGNRFTAPLHGDRIGGMEKVLDIPIDFIYKIMSKQLVENLVKRGKPKGELNKSEL